MKEESLPSTKVINTELVLNNSLHSKQAIQEYCYSKSEALWVLLIAVVAGPVETIKAEKAITTAI